jgi:pantoate kinase
MRAFAPGSVTTVFAPPAEGEDRSRGASVAIRDGVTVHLEPASETAVTVDGEPAPFEPVELVLEALDVTAAVDIRPEVPLGCGFGASGAATLSTGLAADAALDLGRSRRELLSAAHRAEVEARTGLGDVFIQEMGGIVVGTGGELDRHESDERLEYASLGGIETGTVLGDEDAMARVREAGLAAFEHLGPEPALADLVPIGWEFARSTGLATDRVHDLVERVESRGGDGTMAMVGETVVATGVEAVLENGTRIANEGARVDAAE